MLDRDKGCKNSVALFTHAMLALSKVPPCTDRYEATEAVLKVLLCKKSIEDRLLETAALSDQGGDAMDSVFEVGGYSRLDVNPQALIFHRYSDNVVSVPPTGLPGAARPASAEDSPGHS